MRALIRIFLLAALAAIALSACGGSEEATTVEMLDNSFVPESITVSAGEPITFTNIGAVEHNAIAADGSWSTTDAFGGNLQADETVDLTIDTPGEYEYYCDLHAIQKDDGSWAGMVGTITVTEPEASGPSLVAGDLVVAQEDDAPEPELISADVPIEWTGVTRNVPADYPTIQAGVDAADPGDLVLVGPGVYKEAVQVVTPGITLRGTDRNEVILDGEFTRDNGVFVVADGVAVENMTARSYMVNGFFWSGVTGYRGSYLTSIDNRVYGIYPFDSVDGLIEFSYASGSDDGGYYIGQCENCRAVLTDSVAERNGMAYSGTNSSGEIFIVNNVFRDNQSGVVPNTLDSELYPPVNSVYVGGNLIIDTGQPVEEVPFNNVAWAPRGTGVALFGSVGSTIEKNTIINSLSSGVLVQTMIDNNVWPATDNIVRDNVIVGSGRADVSFGGPIASGNCVDQDGATTVPALARWTASCDGLNLPMPWGFGGGSEPLGRFVEYAKGAVESIPHGAAADPELDFDSLAVDAPVVPAVDVFDTYGLDVSTITAPAIPDGTVENDRHLVILGVDTTLDWWPLYAGMLLWWLPLLVWVVGGIWALMRVWGREASVAEKVVWTVLVVLLPVVGIFLFALVGNRDAAATNRWLSAWTMLIVWVVAVYLLFAPLFARA